MGALMLASTARSDAGLVRENNEDTVFVSPRVVAVADGVGGAAAGEVASAVAVDQVIHMDKCRLTEPLEAALDRAVRAANDTVGFVAACRPRLAGMGTTLTAVAIENERYAIAHVGDSRAYLRRAGRVVQLTRDDSYVQELLDAGQIDAAAARTHPQRSVVTKALDGGAGREATVTSETAREGDRLLLCSDGLSDLVDDDELAAALALPSREEAADALVERALLAGGRDNVSVVVADVVPRSGPHSGWLSAIAADTP